MTIRLLTIRPPVIRHFIRGVPFWFIGIGLMLSACESMHLYDGNRRPSEELAQITGDLRISGGLPVSVQLRSVDDEEIGLRYRGVYVLPGDHDLLIDCTVTESKHISRHHLHVDVDAGVKYRIVASTGPGNRSCDDVQLVGHY